MRFDLIEGAVLAGEVDCGVLIHEGRFTYADKGLHKLADLGEVWEQQMHCPIPLGAIAVRRDLGAGRRAAHRRRDSRQPSRMRGRIRTLAPSSCERTRRRCLPR